MVVSVSGAPRANPDEKAAGISEFSRRALSASAHSGISISPVSEKCRNARIETPLAGSSARSFRVRKVSNAQGMIRSEGSASYGYQIAAAAAEVVCCPTSLAKIETRSPRSARATPQVRPDTPAPTIAIALAMRDVARAVRSLPTKIDRERGAFPGEKGPTKPLVGEAILG